MSGLKVGANCFFKYQVNDGTRILDCSGTINKDLEDRYILRDSNKKSKVLWKDKIVEVVIL